MTPGAIASTVIGAPASSALDVIQDVARDAAGNLYVSESGKHRIRKIDAQGVVTTLAGDGTAGLVDGPGATARFSAPRGIGLDDAGNLYVADAGNNRIRRVAPDGTTTTIAGADIPPGGNPFMDGLGCVATFFTPVGLGVDPPRKRVFVADQLFGKVRMIQLP